MCKRPWRSGPGKKIVRVGEDEIYSCKDCALLFIFPFPNQAEMVRRHSRVLGEMADKTGFTVMEYQGYSFPLERAKEGLPAQSGLPVLAAADRIFGRAAE